MPVVRLAHGEIHYRHAGSGTPLVLLHANPGDSRDFDAVFAALADAHEVFAPDWPGFGESRAYADPSTCSAMAFYETLVEFLDVLDLPRAAFLGNSVGGYAAARLAIEHPGRVERLVLVSPGGFTPHNALTRWFCRWQASAFALPPAWFARLYLRHRTPVTTAMHRRAATEQSTPRARLQARAVWRSFPDPAHDLSHAAAAIRCPVQLVFGRYDPVIPYWRDGRVAQRAMPHATLRLLPTGHAPFAEAPAAFLAAIQPFLAG